MKDEANSRVVAEVRAELEFLRTGALGLAEILDESEAEGFLFIDLYPSDEEQVPSDARRLVHRLLTDAGKVPRSATTRALTIAPKKEG